MPLYDKVFQYITESWISFKEEDNTTDADTNQDTASQQTDDNQEEKDTKKVQPNLDWKMLVNSAILYNGDKSNPNAMVWIFADQVNIGCRKEWLDKNNSKEDKDDKSNYHIDNKFKNDLKKFIAAATVGGVIAQGVDKTTDFFSDKDTRKSTTNKKNKNAKGESDKIASLFDIVEPFEINDFKDNSKLETDFKQIALITYHIPEDLLNQYIAKVQQLIKDKEKQDAKAASAAKKKAKATSKK